MGLICTVLGIWCATQAIVGHPRVVDGDTLAFGSTHVRLWGIDAPEMSDKLGRQARATMIQAIGANEVKCIDTGARSHKRIVSRCYVGKGELNAAMVMFGAALDCPRYSKGEYRQIEPPGARERIKQKKYCS